jgi:hypothetical protein
VHDFLEEDGMTNVRKKELFDNHGMSEGLSFKAQLKQMDIFVYGESENENEMSKYKTQTPDLDVIKESSEYTQQNTRESPRSPGTGGGGGYYKGNRPSRMIIPSKMTAEMDTESPMSPNRVRVNSSHPKR